jgi:hypothetical protein
MLFGRSCLIFRDLIFIKSSIASVAWNRTILRHGLPAEFAIEKD